MTDYRMKAEPAVVTIPPEALAAFIEDHVDPHLSHESGKRHGNFTKKDKSLTKKQVKAAKDQRRKNKKIADKKKKPSSKKRK